ncbi:phospholipase D family protein [Acidobacteriota bacterium]
MKLHNGLKTIFSCAMLVALTACASIPADFEQVPSHSWQKPEETSLGIFFDKYAPEDPSLSGVRLLANPREAFRARFGGAYLAEKSLDLQYYLWKGDLTGSLLLYRAVEAADRGVHVRILIDDIYHSGRDLTYSTIDSHPNMEVRVYNPMGSRGAGKGANMVYHKGSLDHRMHNKIFLVDSAVAVLGGRNIGDDYFGVDEKLNFRDLDVLAVGPAAKEAGEAFDMYWNSPAAVPITVVQKKPVEDGALERGREELRAKLDEMDALPYTVPKEEEETRRNLERIAEELVWAKTRIIIDSLNRFQGGSESAFVELTNELAESAKSEFVIETAYLIPAMEGIAKVAEVTERGIRVRILTNSMFSNNHLSVHAHYKKYRKRMIEAGIELHELRPDPEILEHYKQVESRVAESHAGLHSKAFVVDRRLSMIGSYNMDPRSRIWNSEIGLLIDSEEFAEHVLEIMETDLEPANSYRVTLDEKGKLVWTAEGPDGPKTWNKEPGSTAWQRFKVRFMSWIPMEKEL